MSTGRYYAGNGLAVHIARQLDRERIRLYCGMSGYARDSFLKETDRDATCRTCIRAYEKRWGGR